MTITQTIEIPANRRITLEVPREIPTGKVIIAFTPLTEEANSDDCLLCTKYRDPKTGNPRFNAETIAAIEEGRAMMRNEIPAKRFGSLNEMWDDLIKDDPDD
jgi:hypothetical protein